MKLAIRPEQSWTYPAEGGRNNNSPSPNQETRIPPYRSIWSVTQTRTKAVCGAEPTTKPDQRQIENCCAGHNRQPDLGLNCNIGVARQPKESLGSYATSADCRLSGHTDRDSHQSTHRVALASNRSRSKHPQLQTSSVRVTALSTANQRMAASGIKPHGGNIVYGARRLRRAPRTALSVLARSNRSGSNLPPLQRFRCLCSSISSGSGVSSTRRNST